MNSVHPQKPGTAVSVVIPVYNSAGLLRDLTRRVDTALSSTGIEFDIILVNDGSSDASWTEILALSQANPRVVGLDLVRNYGQQGAIMAGVMEARGETIVTLDDDLEQQPEDIPRLLAKLDEGYDVVFGLSQKDSRGLFRRTLSFFGRKTVERFSKFGMCATPFRAFRSRLIQGHAFPNGPCSTIDVYLTWFAGKVGMVQVDYHPSRKSRSGQHFSHMLTLLTNVITGISLAPLRIASYTGVAFLFSGVACFVSWIALHANQPSSVRPPVLCFPGARRNWNPVSFSGCRGRICGAHLF